jgi:site-specific recombinase XerD
MTNSTDKEGGAITLEKGLGAFSDALLGKNRSSATLRAYRTDVLQFMTFLHENNVAITEVGNVGKMDVLEYLAALSRRGLTGVARARKLSALREYFRFCESLGLLQKSPTAGIDTPKREKHSRHYLRSDEFTKMLSLAGGNPRDYAILQVFLQTGIRVSELAGLTLTDVDLHKPAITVRGKGNSEREIALEKRGMQALKNYLAVRPQSLSEIIFLNYQGTPISERGIRKLVVKYTKNAGITNLKSPSFITMLQ